MSNLEQFLADYPFKLFIKEEDWFSQTADEAKHMIQKAQARKERIRARNLRNQANNGFPTYRYEKDLNLDMGLQYYTSQRGQRRRYQLGRD